jgi:hypothetical protein
MSDTSIDIDTLDAAVLSAGTVARLGDSALGHAVRRVLERCDFGSDQTAPDPIAAHDSHI